MNGDSTLCRAIAAEVQQAMNDEANKYQWAVQLKQKLNSFKEEAKKDLEKMDVHTALPTSSKPTKGRKADSSGSASPKRSNKQRCRSTRSRKKPSSSASSDSGHDDPTHRRPKDSWAIGVNRAEGWHNTTPFPEVVVLVSS